MSRATPQARDFARRLVAYETRGRKSVETKAAMAFLVCEKLRRHLKAVVGNAGISALLSRSLTVAGEEVPWLRSVAIKADGSLEGVDELEGQVNPEEMTEGSVALLAQLLGLLVAFIGENLTLRMVSEVWPKLPLSDLDVRKKEKK